MWGRVEGARRRRVRWSQGVRIKALAEVLSLWPPSARVSAFDFLVPRGDIGSRARLHFTFAAVARGDPVGGYKGSVGVSGFGMNVCSFWYERGLIRAVLGLLG